jgi:uncharacterized membrane protein YeaQ/YmgE (transglycosylase-associated protein family)
MSLLGFLLIGGLAGWLASLLTRGRGFGCLPNLVVGILGAVLGGWLFGQVGLAPKGGGGAFVSALVGAVILLSVLKILKKA